MYIDISTDDKLSKLSLKLSYISIFILVLSVVLNIFFPSVGIILAGLCFSGFVMSIFGVIISNMARENEEEHISRCIRAKVTNIILCIIYVTIYII